jgi:hypothetical protein
MSPALAGFLTAKQKGKASAYFGGALSSLKSAPGVNEVSSLVSALTNENMMKGIGKYLTSFATSRSLPVIVQDLFKDHPVQRIFFGSNGIQSDLQVKEGAIKPEDWAASNSAEYKQFGEKLGQEKLKAANDLYNKLVRGYSLELFKSSEYNNMSPTEQTKILTALKSQIKQAVFNQYGFKYTKGPSVKYDFSSL